MLVSKAAVARFAFVLSFDQCPYNVLIEERLHENDFVTLVEISSKDTEDTLVGSRSDHDLILGIQLSVEERAV